MTARNPTTEDQSRRFLEMVSDICCTIGLDGCVVTANAAAKRILGYSPEELRRRSVIELLHPQDRPMFEQALRDLFGGVGTSELENRFLTAGGTYRWLRWTATKGDDHVFAIAHDVTVARANSQERFRRQFETSRDSIVLIDGVSGVVLNFNPRTNELLGYPDEEMRGKELWVCPPFTADGIGRRMFDELQRSPTFRDEAELRTKDGGTNACELLANIYSEAGHSMIQANIRDISERKRVEAALRESEERFRVLVEGVTDYAIFTIDINGLVETWYAGAERILGFSAEEMIGHESSIMFTPEDRARGEHLREMETAARDGRAEDERWHLRKSGERFFASGVLTSLWWPDGTLHGYAKIMRDITERKTNEDAMREAQKLESVGILAGGVAHDFNNLLTGIIGNASLAVEDLPPSSPARRPIEEVIAAGKRAADLTRQLLAYAGKGRFTLQSFNISEAVTEILELIHASIPEHVRLQLHLDRNLPAIEADPMQIQQIAMNLVINAAEAIEESGTIRISSGRLYLGQEDLKGAEGLSHMAPGEYVFLQVEDTGSGMTPETKARIFDPFFTTKFTGRGLGLAAVFGIVRGYRGGIQVLTAPDHGTTFRVFLPVSSQPARPLKTGEPSITERGSGTILLAEDDGMVRSVSRQALERRGYRVLLAENGKQAVDLFRRESGAIDLVILDLAMPVMGGEEAHHHIKATRSDVPVLVSSGYSELMASSRFGHGGMDAFIQKPYTASQLVDKVQKVLSGVPERSEL
jgi:PAS domain S-box-containing protein